MGLRSDQRRNQECFKAFLGGFIQGLVEHYYFEPRQTMMREARAVCVLLCEELLQIYREVGKEKGKAMIDALAFGF